MQIPTKIAYSTAKKRKAQTGNCFCTSVSWRGAPILTELVEFATIGAVEVVLPPVLPAGYAIECHDQWLELLSRIYDKKLIPSMSFDDLDNLERDRRKLDKVTEECLGAWLSIWSDRPDYLEYVTKSDDAWSSLLEYFEQPIMNLLEKSCPHLEPHSVQAGGIGNRAMPPSLREALALMFGNDIPGMVDRIAERLEDAKQ